MLWDRTGWKSDALLCSHVGAQFTSKTCTFYLLKTHLHYVRNVLAMSALPIFIMLEMY